MDMGYLFINAKGGFNQPIGDWDTSSVTNMEAMFHRAYAFNQDIGDWDTSSVATCPTCRGEGGFSRMFSSAAPETHGNWQPLTFNQPIGGWDTSKMTMMGQAFDSHIRHPVDIPYDTSSTFDQDIEGWDVGQVTNMDFMFRDGNDFCPSWNTGHAC